MTATPAARGTPEIADWAACRAALHGTQTLSTDAYRLLWRDLSGIRDFVALPAADRQLRRDVLTRAFGRVGATAQQEAIRRAMSRCAGLKGDFVTVADVTSVQAAATYELLGLDPARGPEIEAAAAIATEAGSVQDFLATRTVFHDVLRAAAAASPNPPPYSLLAAARRLPALDPYVDVPLLFSAFITTLAVHVRRDLPTELLRQLAAATPVVQQRVRVERAHRASAQEALRLQEWLTVPRAPRRGDGHDTASAGPGMMTMVRLGRANRDPSVFVRPDTFDPWRPDRRRSIAFGAGPHRCPGRRFSITLASAIASCVLDERTLRPAPDQDADILAVRSRCLGSS